jgi:DNA-binding beta-propeller fold protein YncE
MISNAATPIVTTEKVHGICVNPSTTSFYATQQDRSALYRFDFTNPLSPDNMTEIDLIQGVQPVAGELKPHEVAFTPDGSKFIVTCSGTNEVRIYDAATETLLNVISVGDDPSEMSFSPTYSLVFVTCMEDLTTWNGAPGLRGSVAVIQYDAGTLEKTVYTGFQPHGIAVDESKGLVYVANRNIVPGGPAPHHSSACGGRNGYLTAIRISDLELLQDFKCELIADPYGVAVK